MKKIITFVLTAALSLTILTGCGKDEAAKAAPQREEAAAETAAPTIQVREPAREGIRTLLVGCLEEYEGQGFQNGDRADFLMLLVVDEKQGTTAALQLNPDTMVSYMPMGKTEPEEMPLGMVYTYGSGGSDSFISGSSVIQKLLGGISIDHYMTFTMESVAVVNDMLGGFEVTITEDFAELYPAYTAGEQVVLKGEEAGEFFCFRDDADVSKEKQMDRQRQYMAGMFNPFMKKAQNEEFLTQLTFKLGEGFQTDLTITQMLEMMELLGGYELDEKMITIPGTSEKVDGENRYYADEAALKAIVDELFR